MTSNSHPIRYGLALFALLFAFSVPDAIAQRQRIVRRSPAGAADLTGNVVDAVTQQPLSEVRVTIGEKITGTGPDGRFTIRGIPAGHYTISFEHWAHAPLQEAITLAAGPNSRSVQLTPKPVANFVGKDGTTHPVDPDSIRFGYIVAFAGWQAFEWIELCLPSGGETVTIQVAEMTSVTFPGTRTESTDCCSLSPGTIARVTRKNGAVVEGTIRSSCSGYEIYAIGRNRDTGVFENFPVLQLERVDVP